jgi:hypothetical protein
LSASPSSISVCRLARHRAGGELAVGVAALVLDQRDLDLEAALTAERSV